MTGYTRQSVAEIISGEIVSAQPLSDEFDALEAAFHAVTGHTHDGSTGSGPQINLVTSVQGILPVINGGTGATNLNSFVQITGAQTITGLKTLSLSNATTLTDYIAFKPTDYTTGKPGLFITKSATAGIWNIQTYDGTNNAGTINFVSSTGLTWNSVQLVDLSSAQTLTNKTINGATLTVNDSTFTIQDNGDTTKKLQFELSGITAGTTRTLTVPNITDTIVTLTASQTLTNKTINSLTLSGTVTNSGTVTWSGTNTGGTWNSGTINATTLQVGGVSVVDLSSSQTLTNKTLTTPTLTNPTINAATLTGTLSGGTFTSSTITRPTITLQDSTTTFQDNGDNTKQMIFELSGISTGTTRTITIPNASTTMVGTDATQTLTNKTLTSPTINSGTLNGTYTGSPSLTITTGDATTSQNWLIFQPSDYTTGKPRLSIHKSATANIWELFLFDGTNSAGTINFVSTTGLTWNSVQLVDLSTSQTLTSKTLTNPTINAAAVSGTWSGSRTRTGLDTVSLGTATTALSYFLGQPTDYTTGKPRFSITKNASATQWDIEIYDGTNNNGTINFNTQNLNWSGAQIVTVSDTQTLTNKTLTSPALTGTPTAPTAANGTNTTQIATTAFVQSAVGTGGFVTTNGAQLLTNKGFEDSSDYFYDNSDNTKIMQFQLSGISTGTTRTLTVPDVSGTLAVLETPQIFTARQNIQASNATTLTEYLQLKPTDYTTGKPYLTFQKSATATTWNIAIFDGVDNTGTINLSATTVKANNVDVATISGTQTLTNKTITSATLSGTTALGTSTLSGDFTMSGTPTITGGLTVGGGLTIGATNNATCAIEMGYTGGAATVNVIDFHTGVASIDYDTRIHSSAATGVVGGGTLNLISGVLQWAGVQIADISRSQTFTNKTISGGTFSGTIAGSPIYSGTQTITINTATTAAIYLQLKPSDYAAGKPLFYINKDTSATQWNMGITDGGTTGTLNIATSALQWNGVQLVDLSSSQTLTNKTISGGTFSGTIAGTHTYSGAITVQSTVTATNLILTTAGSASIEIGRIDGVASTPFIDFHSGATAVDYDARIITTGGTGVAGGGGLDFRAATLTWSGHDIVGTDLTQTLTNKTFSGGTVNATTLQVGSRDVSMVKIASATASASASISFTSIPTGFSYFVLVVEDAVGSAGGISNSLLVQVSTDNGASWKTGASDYYESTTAKNNLVGIIIPGNTSTFQHGFAKINLYGLNNASRSTMGHVDVNNAWVSTTSNQWAAEASGGVVGARAAAEADNAFRLLPSTGNITSGTFTLYGVRS